MEGVQIEATCDYFDQMLELIPARYYIAQETNTEQWKSKFIKNKKQAAPQLALKLASKKAKRAKFNGDNTESVSEIQKKQLSETKSSGSAELNHASSQRCHKVQSEPAGSIDALRERLKQRIQDLKNGRGGVVKRGRDVKITSKSARKAAKKALKLKNAKLKSLKNGTSESKNSSNEADDVSVGPVTDAQNVATTTDEKSSSSLLFQSVTFGKVDNELDINKKTGVRSVPGKSSKSKQGKSLASLLKQAEDRERRVEELKQSGAGKELLKAEVWETMMSRAKGEKVKNDAKLLRKALKKKENAKKKSAKAWEERNAKVEQTKQEAYDKKQANILERKNPKATKLLLAEGKGTDGRERKKGRRGGPNGEFGKHAIQNKKAETKKRRLGAGFEGKHANGFLNKRGKGNNGKVKGAKGKGGRLRYEDFKGRGGAD